MTRLCLILLVAAAVPAGAQDKKRIALPPDSLYLLKSKTLEGQPADLKEYAGQVALVVNLASQ